MIFRESPLAGAFLIEPDKCADERGFFARSYCLEEFGKHGLELPVAQCNVSFNRQRGTLRGMHFQRPPKSEPKLVRCTRGAIYDVVVDLRRDSATYCRWFSAQLTAENHAALFVPTGFAHGFQTLADQCEVFYQMGQFYSAEHAGGVRWNDPAFGVHWPLEVTSISERDSRYNDFRA